MLLSVLIRDMKKAELAVQKMRTVANSTQRIELFHLDLANLETVDQVCSQSQENILPNEHPNAPSRESQKKITHYLEILTSRKFFSNSLPQKY